MPDRSLSSRQRWLSGFEVLIGAGVVIGHNVFRVLPDEVPILFILFWIFSRLRDRRWIPTGLNRPKSWARTAVTALLAAVVLQAGGEFIIEAMGNAIFHRPEQVSSVLINSAHGWKFALQSLAIVCTFAALLAVSVLFGFGHFYKGSAGVLDSTYSG